MLRPKRTAADVEAIRRNAALAGVDVRVQPDPDTEVWPEHAEVMEVFVAMGTQVNVAPTGAVLGYSYPSLLAVMDAHQVPACARRQMLADFRVLEAEALTLMRERARG